MRIGHETSDASVRGIVWALLGLAAGAALALALVYGVFWYLADHPLTNVPPSPMAAEGKQVPPAPRVDDHPATELKDLHVYEDQILGTYGWTDKQRGIVRIPIDQAMELQLKKGFPSK